MKRLLLTLSLLFLSVIPAPQPLSSPAGQQLPPLPPPPVVSAEVHNPKLEGILEELARGAEAGMATAQALGQRAGVEVTAGMVRVVIEPQGGDPARVDLALLSSLGAELEASSAHLLKVEVPVNKLLGVAEQVGGISYIRLPHRPYPTLIGEGVGLTGAELLHRQGLVGQGVKVAVIDLGFSGLSQAQAQGELPGSVVALDFTGRSLGGTSHGTAVAEIVHDMAPEAQLYLLKIGDEVDLENAVDYCIEQNIRVINHSVGWVNTSFGDGSGIIGEIASAAVAQGLLWVNSAGNAASRHWEGPFSDGDGDGWEEFSPADETLEIAAAAGETIEVFLTWNDWPTSGNDYDFFLFYDGDGDGSLSPEEIVASSTNWQTGREPPTERIYYHVPVTGPYYLGVWAKSAPGQPELEIFSFEHDLKPAVARSSIMEPGNARGVLTVGAINFQNWASGPQEPFSSQGPTADGRVKPDLSGPDGVSSWTAGWSGEFGSGRFFGTSAAAPHVAGCAALLISQVPHITATQLRERLLAKASDMGFPGKDNIYGAGRLSCSGGALSPLPLEEDLDPSTPPQDLDGDGLYEDLDGDGDFDIDDVILFARALLLLSPPDPAVVGHPEFYDFDGDGDVDIRDVIVLARRFFGLPPDG